MDASRLLAVLDDIEAEMEGGLVRHLASIMQQYTAARDSPTVDNATAIQRAVGALIEYTELGRFSQYPPSKSGVLVAIGGESRLGPGLKNRLISLLSVPGQTTAGIVTAMNALNADISTFRKACLQTRAGLRALGITPHTIPAGEFEVGVLIPEALVDHKLSSLLKELGTWNNIVRGFQEVTGDEEREVSVVGLASGSYETYIPLGLAAATYLSMTIDKVLEWYLKVLEIRKHRQELKELGAPIAEAGLIKKHEKDLVENGIQELAKEIVKKAHPKVEPNRKHELITHLSISIRQITRFVDKGGTVEVAATPPDASVEPDSISEEATQEEKTTYEDMLNEYRKLSEQVQKISAIMQSGSALGRLPARPEPILQIESDIEVDDSPKEKTSRRKAEKTN